MPFKFSIPTPAGPFEISIDRGSSAIFVGANGSGKTRLAVTIENSLGMTAHRVSAHRALSLNPTVPKVSESTALRGLRTGWAGEGASQANRHGSRWQGNMAVSLLNDFDFLVQSLFADQMNQTLQTHKQARAGVLIAHATKFERLTDIWERLLPHRKLEISGDDILVNSPAGGDTYKGSDMSDGERAIFYLIAQTLTVADQSLLIVDEPELHVHRSIMSKLWDELEAARPDCGFVFITHDLEFSSVRVAQKFVIGNYTPAPSWTVEKVPEDSGFGEEIATLILGSRRPILFVEGTGESIDQAIYRCTYPNWTIIPRGSCEEVIHSVVTMRRNQALTRVTCAGIVDADDYSAEEQANLVRLGVATLPVTEIESLILLPSVSRAIAEAEALTGVELEKRLRDLKIAIFNSVKENGAVDAAVIRYCRRRIDRLLKKIDFSEAKDEAAIAAAYQRETAALDISKIAQELKGKIQEAIKADDLNLLLAYYDNKGLLALAARFLKASKLSDFESWLMRTLKSNNTPGLSAAIRECLPKIEPA